MKTGKRAGRPPVDRELTGGKADERKVLPEQKVRSGSRAAFVGRVGSRPIGVCHGRRDAERDSTLKLGLGPDDRQGGPHKVLQNAHMMRGNEPRTGARSQRPLVGTITWSRNTCKWRGAKEAMDAMILLRLAWKIVTRHLACVSPSSRRRSVVGSSSKVM